ncbi:MAG: ATP-binding cassette domain-containing protein [Bacteroidales bacterium]|nr:ATP-binding cassette domain-containing protein [Candidatus Cryptobacteroides onthequi]
MLVDSVHLEFGQHQVLQSAYLTAKTGYVTGVLGRNGTGKSCLFKCIMGGIKPQNMFIRINDERETDYAHIGNRVKYLPQNLFMPSNMSLNEAFSLYGVDYDGLVTFDTKYHTYQHKTFNELSGGEARIVEMYLVLMSDADFCILDEPFSNIAPNCVDKMQSLIQTQKKNKGIIISDHLYEDILEVTDDLFLLRDGYTFPIKSRDDLIRNGYILR